MSKTVTQHMDDFLARLDDAKIKTIQDDYETALLILRLSPDLKAARIAHALANERKSAMEREGELRAENAQLRARVSELGRLLDLMTDHVEFDRE